MKSDKYKMFYSVQCTPTAIPDILHFLILLAVSPRNLNGIDREAQKIAEQRRVAPHFLRYLHKSQS